MVNRLFALASVTVLTGLVSTAGAAGCLDHEVAPLPAEDSGADAKKDDGPSLPSEEPESRCYKDDPVDVGDVVYKPARVQAGACTPNVFKLLEEAAASSEDGEFTVTDIKEALAKGEPASCAECIFGPDGDKWAPIVMNGDKIARQNFVGCIEVKSGKVECGASVFKWLACLEKACGACAAGARNACTEAVQQTACKELTDEVVSYCGGDKLNRYYNQCRASKYVLGQVGGTIQELCVGDQVQGDGGMDTGAGE